MQKSRAFLTGLILLLVLLVAPFSNAQSGVTKKVASQADLPRHSYPVEGLASTLVQADNAVFGAFAAKVRTDIESELRDYAIADRSTLRDLLSAKLGLQEIAGEYQEALKTVESLRSLEDKPSPKLTTGLIARAFLNAAIETGHSAGQEFDQSFARRYDEAVAGLPWGIVQDWAKQSYASARLAARAVALAQVMTELDPAVQKSHALDDAEAAELIWARRSG